MVLEALVGRCLRQFVIIIPNELEVIAFNDIGDLKTMAHLLKYDSNYGRFDGTVEVNDDGSHDRWQTGEGLQGD